MSPKSFQEEMSRYIEEVITELENDFEITVEEDSTTITIEEENKYIIHNPNKVQKWKWPWQKK